MGIYYHYILIYFDLTCSDYAFCNSNWDAHISFDLELEEAKLGHLYSLSEVSRFNTQFPFIKQKATQEQKNKKKIEEASILECCGETKVFPVSLSSFPSRGIPEAGGQSVTQGRKDQQFLSSLCPLVSKHTVILNQLTRSLNHMAFPLLQLSAFNDPKLEQGSTVIRLMHSCDFS